jgi:hypothetical protein
LASLDPDEGYEGLPYEIQLIPQSKHHNLMRLLYVFRDEEIHQDFLRFSWRKAGIDALSIY